MPFFGNSHVYSSVSSLPFISPFLLYTFLPLFFPFARFLSLSPFSPLSLALLLPPFLPPSLSPVRFPFFRLSPPPFSSFVQVCALSFPPQLFSFLVSFILIFPFCLIFRTQICRLCTFPGFHISHLSFSLLWTQ